MSEFMFASAVGWDQELTSFLATLMGVLAAVAAAYLFTKNKKEERDARWLQAFRKNPWAYSFIMFASAFLGASLVRDLAPLVGYDLASRHHVVHWYLMALAFALGIVLLAWLRSRRES